MWVCAIVCGCVKLYVGVCSGMEVDGRVVADGSTFYEDNDWCFLC